MDEFVQRVVAGVLGGKAHSEEPLARPNYQREKAKGRLLIGDLASAASSHAHTPAPGSNDGTPALRRAALAAGAASAPPRERANAAPRVAHSRIIDAPPRKLTEILGVRLRPGQALGVVTLEDGGLGDAIVSDAILVRRAVPFEAMNLTLEGSALTVVLGGDTGPSVTILAEIEAAWTTGGARRGVAFSEAVSPKTATLLGIGRREAVAALNGMSAAEGAAVLAELWRGEGVFEADLRAGCVLIHGSADAVKTAAARMETISQAMER